MGKVDVCPFLDPWSFFPCYWDRELFHYHGWGCSVRLWLASWTRWNVECETVYSVDDVFRESESFNLCAPYGIADKHMVQVDVAVSPCNAVVLSVVSSMHCYGVSCLFLLVACHFWLLFDATQSALSLF